jgi:tRNA pseudouridine55 synthase
VPPAYSAIKVDGKVAYRAARAGSELELEPRSAEVSMARFVGLQADPPSWDVELAVSKGTYVRAIARDVGRGLDCAAHLSALRRSASGTLRVDDAVPLDEIVQAAEPCEVAERFTDPVAALGLPAVEVDEQGAFRVSAGNVLDARAHCLTECPEEGPVAIVREEVLLAVYSVHAGVLRAQTVLPGGVMGGSS